MIPRLGVRSKTGAPVGPAGLQTANVARVGVVGMFTRSFKELMTTDNSAEVPFLTGTNRADMYGSRIVESMIRNAGPTVLTLHIASWCPGDAATAEVVLNDANSSPTVKVLDAFRGKTAFGTFGNATGVKVSHYVKALGRLSATTGIGPTTITLAAVRDFAVGDCLRITNGGTPYETVATAVNLETREITIDGTGIPALAVDDLVEAVAFRIAVFRRSPSGEVVSAGLPYDRWNLSTELEDTDAALSRFDESHPLIRLEDQGSASLSISRFPAETAGVVWLTGGSNGTAPASAADWNGMQSMFDTTKVFFVALTDTYSAEVLRPWEEWARGRLDHPLVWAPLAFRDSDWTTLGEFCEQFIVNDGWRQLMLVYGWRYVTDDTVLTSRPVSKIPVFGAVLGRWLFMIYDGKAHRVPAEPAFELEGFMNGPDPVPEDDDAVETAMNGSPTVRDRLYHKGANIVRRFMGAVRVRNFRTVSSDIRTRDANIHATGAILKELVEINFKRKENRPLKRSELDAIAREIKTRILGPAHRGNLPPFYDAEVKEPGKGPFADALPDGNPAELDDVVRLRYGLDVNPEDKFRAGDVEMILEFVPAGLMRSFTFVAAPAIRLT